ncbi:TAXI family TRAP transporter solute-binding subunit [Roseateles oligotrophus]|uniref:TAXI family TRAP transporter solute-binding subunit n=1 Tax=Roseateles oligotrophus TaxID=1769250 RepID=A0ABT2YB36_9BURK|nr:TAXI family TRAP transporter solute-binding subunit [Roseateles oligotrophus]MCV2367514.1 TAXI family TRAP transporter solute-binding subunit [Roseateles oligotrophus]
MKLPLIPVFAVLAAALLAPCSWAAAMPEYKIVTASEKGTYFAIGRDLAKFVAPDAGFSLEVLPTSGSAANVKLMRYEPGVKMAVVQADVYQAFLDKAAGGNPEAAAIIKPLRVILPLYNTEIHYIVRADSELNYLHDIKDARINGGLVGSGAALITHTLYRMMFNGPMAEDKASFLSNEEALVKLIGDKSVDVVVVAAGQPAPLIANMKPEAQKFIKLLKFDPTHASAQAALNVYAPAKVLTSNYPNLLTEDFTTISVGAFLVTYDYNLKDTVESFGRLGKSLCQNFSRLQAEGHPKWREVDLSLPKLAPGWTYYPPTTYQLRNCVVKKVKKCSAEERILGLCG